MNSQTAQRPGNKRPARPARSKRYVRQTAHVEARRDGKPLIFGWGGHLSRNEKTRLQRRAIWAVTILVTLVIIGIIVGFWVNINVITPGLAISSVNGHAIPQSDYRKLVAVDAQLDLNKMNGPHGLQAQATTLQGQVAAQQKIIDDTTKLITGLNSQISKLPKGSSQLAALQAQLKADQDTLKAAQSKHDALNTSYQNLTTQTIAQQNALYNQSQVGNDSVQWLQENQLIIQWLAKQGDSIHAKIEPTASAVSKALNDFTANLPKGTTYSSFMSTNSLSDQDVRVMLTLITRRQNMQTYLASLITSPTYQVQARAIATDTQANANTIIADLKKGQKFADLAKLKMSVPPTTANGELGWLARYQYIKVYSLNIGGTIDNWLFDPGRRINEISSVLVENGTFHVVQIEAISETRAVDATTLKGLQDNALTAWILSQKALPGVTVTPFNSDMLLDPSNMPASLPNSVPGVGTPTAAATQ